MKSTYLLIASVLFGSCAPTPNHGAFNNKTDSITLTTCDSCLSIKVTDIDSIHGIQRFNFYKGSELIHSSTYKGYESGYLFNYYHSNDSIALNNPTIVDSILIYELEYNAGPRYAVLKCINLRHNKEDSTEFDTKVFFFINDVERKHIIKFTGDKYKLLRAHQDTVTNVCKYSYTGKLLDCKKYSFQRLFRVQELAKDDEIMRQVLLILEELNF